MEHVFTDQNFAQDVLASSSPVFVDFWAEWCAPCRAMGPVVDEIASEIDATMLKVGKMNIDENIETPGHYRVMSIPTFIVFQHGQEVERLVGSMTKDEMKEKLARFIA